MKRGGHDEGLVAAEEGLLANLLWNDFPQQGIVGPLFNAKGNAALDHSGSRLHRERANVGGDLVANTQGPADVNKARIEGDGGREPHRELELEGKVELVGKEQLGVLGLRRRGKRGRVRG